MNRSSRLFSLLAFCVLSLAVPARAELERRIVVFSPSTTASERTQAAKAMGARVVRELPLINAVVIESEPGEVRFTENRLLSHAGVLRVDADPRINWLEAVDAPGADFVLPDMSAILRQMSSQKTMDVSAQWWWDRQDVPWGIKRVNAPAAWAKTRGAGVKVAVIDTGINASHPDLKGQVKGGWNAITGLNDFKDDNGHGSHVSGTIAAKNDKKGVVGVAPEAELYGVKVLDAKGMGTFDDVIAGMQWAAGHRMQVVSMSLGASTGTPSLQEAVKALAKAGVVVVAAAGNSAGPVEYPGRYPQVIAVAASDSSDRRASFSCVGPQVAVIAPGVNVKSTSLRKRYASLSGTSMATPHVSGLAALYLASHPGASPEQVRAALAAASTKLPDLFDLGQGAGLPDAAKLVE